PGRGPRSGGTGRPVLHQVGRRRVRPARRRGRLPDRVAARRGPVARQLAGQGRHDRLAGVLPRAQPARHRLVARHAAPWWPLAAGVPAPAPEATALPAVLRGDVAAPGAAGRAAWPRAPAGAPRHRDRRGARPGATVPRDPCPSVPGRRGATAGTLPRAATGTEGTAPGVVHPAGGDPPPGRPGPAPAAATP